MFSRKRFSLFAILDESPFFAEITVKEREKLISELIETYPQLRQHTSGDKEVGYEASWLQKQTY